MKVFLKVSACLLAAIAALGALARQEKLDPSPTPKPEARIMPGPLAIDPQAAVKRAAWEQAMEARNAMLEGRWEKVADSSYFTVIEVIGGRQEAIELLRAVGKELDDAGVVFTKLEMSEPAGIFAEGPNLFAVLTTTVEMTSPKGTGRLESYTLGISTDRGKTWKFVDGAGLQTKEERAKYLPKMPADLVLPEIKKPVLTPHAARRED